MTRSVKIRLIAAVVFCVCAGVASASVLVPLPGADSISGPDALQPDGGSVATGATAADPAGGPDWAVRVYRSKTGQTCPEAGRVYDGDFGVVDDAGRFTALPVAPSGSCNDLEHNVAAFAVNRYAETRTQGLRSVLFGVVSSNVRSVTLRIAGSVQSLELVGGSFLVVRADDELDDSRLDFTSTDGKTTSYELARVAG
jgi:hypothetical protein